MKDGESTITDRKNAYTYMDYARSDKTGSLKWLYDNMLRFGTDVTNDEKKAYRQNLADITGIKEVTDSNKYSDDTIFKVQQYVLWSFTHNNNQNDTGIEYPTDKLYVELKKKAGENSTYNGNGSSKITIDKSKANITKDGVIGPITISGNNVKNTISISNKQKYSFGLYEDKECKNSISDIEHYNGTFYIKVNENFEAGTEYKIEFDFKVKSYNTKAYCYITTNNVDDGNIPPQPFLMLEREIEENNIDADFKYYEALTGNYSIALMKKSSESADNILSTIGAIGGAKFDIKYGGTNIGEEITTEDGVLSYSNSFNITENNVNDSDKYTIKETQAPQGYNIADSLKDIYFGLTVKKTEKNSKYVIDTVEVTIYTDAGVKVKGFEITKGEPYYNLGNTPFSILVGDNEIITMFKDPPIEGKYYLNIVKKSTESTNSDALGNAEFEIIQTLNGNSNDEFSSIITTNSKGEENVYDDGVKITDISTADEYIIRETKAPDGFTLNSYFNDKDLKLKVTKKLNNDKNKYIIDKVFVSIIAKINHDYELSEEVVKNGQLEYEGILRVKHDETSIQLTYLNPPNKYKLEVKKVDADNVNKTLPDTKFDIGVGEGINASILQNDTLKQNGVATGILEIDDIITGSSKTYWFKERESQSGYENVFGNNSIRLVVYFNEGKVSNTELFIHAPTGDPLDKTKYKELYDKISVEVEKENNEIKLLIKNPKDKIFDLALRKFITSVNGNKINDRIPELNRLSVEAWKKNNTADYYHTKEAYTVNYGDIVEYTIRVYNEGEAKGYAKEITDYLPEGLEFYSSVVDGVNYNWQVNGKNIKTNYLENTLLDSCKIEEQVNGSGTNSGWYADVKVLCKVNLDLTQKSEATYLVNRAEITTQEAEIIYLNDRDSTANNVKTEHSTDMFLYDSNKIYNSETYYPGFEDDDDYEVLKVYPVRDYEFKITKFDDLTDKKLAGAKFSITGISATNGGVAKITDVVNTKNESILENGTTFTMPEDGIVIVKSIGNIMKNSQMEYQFKVEEVKAPENYDIVVKKFNLKVTLNVNNTKKIEITNYTIDTTSYMGTPTGNNARWLSLDNTNDTVRISIANKNTNAKFDLALRKFITGVERNGTKIDVGNREPDILSINHVTYLNMTGTIDYRHTKKAIEVENGDIVTYTIRVYNEGDIAGRASEIKDYLPEGLEFYSSTVDNIDYGWQVNGKEIKTNFLKDILLNKNQLLDEVSLKDTTTWYADVKVKCKVTATASQNTLYLTNRAEITAQEDIRGNKYGDYYKRYQNTDRDSTADTIKNSLNLENYYEQNVLQDENGDYYPGVQDDDDFETVKLVSVKDYKFKLNKVSVDLNGASITNMGDTSGKFIVKQIDENGNTIGEPLKNDEWITGTVQIDEKVNVRTGTSYRYLIEETEASADHQIIYKTIVVKITVSEGGIITPIIETVDGKEYNNVHKKYVTIKYTNENGVLLKIANYKRKDINIQLIKQDEKENQINARFDLIRNGESKWNNELITGNKEYLDKNIEYNKTYTYEFKERSVEGLYNNILRDNKIQIKVKMAPNGYFTYSSGSNGKKYNIVDTNGNILPTTNELYNYVNVEFKEVNGVQTIIVKVTNESYANYKFEIHKIDENNESEYLKDARFTISGPNGNIQTNDTLKQNGQATGIFVKEENGVKTGQTYTYTIVETEAAHLYQNVFNYTSINVNIVINDEGKIDKSNSEVYLQITDWDKYPGLIEFTKINQLLKLDIDSDNNIAKLIIKNPKETRDFNFLLAKTQLDQATPVKGAKIEVQKKDDSGAYNSLKQFTSTETLELIESVTNSALDKTYYYMIEETDVPNSNYIRKIKKAEIEIKVSKAGTISGSIINVQEENSSSMIAYNEEKHGDYIKLYKSGNSFVLIMSNSISYTMSLRKVGTNPSDSPSGGEFKIFKVIEGIEQEILHETFSTNVSSDVLETEINPNSTYVYHIYELNSPDGFNNDFYGIRIILTIKTDKNGSIMAEGTDGTKIDFESIDGTILSSNEKALLAGKCELNITSKNINENTNQNNIEIKLKDTKTEIEPEKYSLRLVKVDRDNEQKKINDVEFSVLVTNNGYDRVGYDADGNPDNGRQNPITGQCGEDGIAYIKDMKLITGATDIYEITEVNIPDGYKSQTNLRISVKVDLEGVTDASQINNDKISVSFYNWGSSTTYPEDYVSCYVGNDGVINVVIPNEPNQFMFELNKTDMNGTLISAQRKSNGTLDGVDMSISSNYGFYYSGIIESGQIIDIVNCLPNTTYTYVIHEYTTKTGYVNVFDNHIITLTIRTDENGQISADNITYSVIRLPSIDNPIQSTVTSKFEEFISVPVISWENGIQKITLNMKNPTGYKVKLNKVDTNNDPVTVATIDAYIENAGEYERKCAINGWYTIEGTTIQYKESGQSTSTSEETIQINPGETQVWKIYESGVNTPYKNVFEGKYIEVTVQMNTVGLLNVVNYKVKDEAGNENVTLKNLYVQKPEFVNINGVQTLNITLKNPMQFKFKLTKMDANGKTELPGAKIVLNGATVIQDGETSYENIYVTDVLAINTFSIREISTTNDHTNVFKDKIVYLKVKLNKEGKFSVVDIQIGEQNTTEILDKSNSIYKYIDYDITEENGIAMLNIKMTNPMQYKLRVHKTDASGNDLSGAVFDINGTRTQGEVSYDKTYDKETVGDMRVFNIKEVSTPEKYVNILDDKMLQIVTRLHESLDVSVVYCSIIDLNTNETIAKMNTDNLNNVDNFNIGTIDEFPYISLEKKIEDGIPVFEVKIQNPMQYKVRLNKTDTLGNPLEGAILQIMEGRNVWSSNGESSYEITKEDIKIGDQIEFNITEISTEKPYVNILKNRYINLIVRMNPNKEIAVVRCQVVENGKDVEENLVNYNITEEDGVQIVNVNIKNPTQFKLELQKTDIEGNELSGAIFDINGKKTQGESVYTVDTKEAQLEKPYTFTIKEDSVQSPYINIFKGEDFYRQLELIVVPVDENRLEVITQIREISASGSAILPKSHPIYNYINIQQTNYQGIPTIEVRIKNPMKYNVIIEKEDTAENKIPGTQLYVYSEFSKEHKDEKALTNTAGKIEFTEEGVREGTYTYFIKEIASANERYVNILEGYYIKVKLDVRADGLIRTLDEEAHKKLDYYEIYKSNEDGEDILMNRENCKIYEYVSVKVEAGEDGVYSLKVKIKNPVTFKVEVDKVDSSNTSLEGAEFEITSDIVKEQQAENKDIVEKEGVEEIREDGTITGTTTEEEGKIKFEETWVNEGIYEYTIKETKTPEAQYVNMLEGYLVKVRVKVNGNGSIQIVDKEGKVSDGKFYIIKENGEEVDNETYEKLKGYVQISIQNNGLKASLGVQVENPVRYKVMVEKEDTAENKIPGTQLYVYSEFSKEHKDEKALTNTAGKIEFTEEGVREGTYTYFIKEIASANERYVNILEGYYIKVKLDVRADGLIRTLDEEAHKKLDYYEIYKSNEDGEDILMNRENCKIYEYVSVKVEAGEDGVYSLKVKIRNPVRYKVKVLKTNMANTPIDRTEIYIKSTFSGEHENLFTRVNGETFINEVGVDKGIQEYKISEVRSASDRYVNILEGYYIKAKVKVSGNGTLDVLDHDGNINNEYYEIYRDDDDNNPLSREDCKIYKYISISIEQDEKGVYVLNVTIKNPTTFKVQLTKVDTEDGEKQNVLPGANFEIESQILKEQQAMHKEEIATEGVNAITEEGKISGTTTEKGDIKFEETWVDSGIYEYVLREIQSPGNQYVNVLEGYQVRIYVKIEANGKIKVVNKNGEIGREKFYIETKTGEQVDNDTYNKLAKYVHISVENNTLKAVLGLKIENPVRFKVRIYKKVIGIESSYLANAKFELISEISGSNILTTDDEGEVEIEESFVSAGDYEYVLREKQVPNNNFANVLENTYIKFTINVAGDGTIKQNGYEIYDENNNLVNKELSTIDENIILDTTAKEDDIAVVKLYISNPQRYSLKLIKTDIDTNLRLNNVEFNVSVYNEKGEHLTLKKASDQSKTIDLSKLVTKEVNGENGVILIDDILIEKSGKYILRLQETKPYLWKQVNDIFVLVNIEVENGQYIVKNMKVLKGTEETNNENSKIIYDENSTTVQIEINNERVKGKYDLNIEKLDSLTKNKIDGAKFKVTVLRDGKESEVYESNGDVTSKNIILPQEVEVTNGTITIKNIRIEEPENYIIRLEEIKAPDTYLDLQEVIELKVTTNLKGEGKEERFILENVELVSGENNGLVSHKYEDNKIILTVENEQFDLSLRKFTTKVISNEGKDNQRVYDMKERIPNVNVQKLKENKATTAEYYHSKDTVKVYAGDTVIYTIRVYNEGQVSGYAEEIIDHLPSNLEFVNDEFNKKFGWILDETDSSLRTVKTNYLSRAENEKNNLIKAFNQNTGELDYREVQIKCKVKEDAKLKEKLTNIAEITKFVGENGREVIDRDSKILAKLPTDEELPDYKENEIEKKYVPGQEDDDDFEKVIVEEFDLALRKFITKVNTDVVTDRVPRFKLDNGKFVYNHTKEPLLVGNENIVEYTIRVYNEGSVDGYASKIKDDIPEGLEFLPDEELNKEYRWIMLDEEGNETDDVNKAKYITTDYLSKEQEKTYGKNLLKAFDSELYESGSIKQPDYKDVKVAFKVVIPNTSDNIVINNAQITDDSNENGGAVEDIDSTPDKWIDGEDDQDIEKIKVQSFDLALRKWVTKTIVIEDGKEQVTETGHQAEDNPEEVVKVELEKSKLDRVVVKFEYKIRVTNEGEVAGYVKEITDYIPEGLRFVAVENPDWEEKDGKIVTDKLANTLLSPGESTEVSILLTWINREDNMGLKVNVAEISKDYNQYETPDIDSTPNNKVEGEDDIDDAPVRLIAKIGIPKTGQAKVIYIVLLAVIITTSVCIIIRKRKTAVKK